MQKQEISIADLISAGKEPSLTGESPQKKIKVLTLVMDKGFILQVAIALKAQYSRLSVSTVKSISALENKIFGKKYDFLIIKLSGNIIKEETASLISEISSKSPNTKIIVILDEITMPMFYYINYLGASGIFLENDITPKDLANTLTKDLKEQILYSPKILRMLISAFHR
jgi:hypothetical protein